MSHNFNLSADYSKGHYNLTASAYYNIVVNKLATAAPYFKSATDRLPYLPYANLDNYRVWGWRSRGSGSLEQWCVGAIDLCLYQRAASHRQGGPPINNQYIPARAHAVNVRIDYDHDFSKSYGLNIGLNGRILSGTDNVEYKNYYDVSAGMVNVSYPAYTIWKLSLVQRFGPAVKVTAALDNLFSIIAPQYYYLNCPLTDGIALQVGLSVDVDKLF